MNFLKLYSRVLTLLGPEARLGWILAAANVALAAVRQPVGIQCHQHAAADGEQPEGNPGG